MARGATSQHQRVAFIYPSFHPFFIPFFPQASMDLAQEDLVRHVQLLGAYQRQVQRLKAHREHALQLIQQVGGWVAVLLLLLSLLFLQLLLLLCFPHTYICVQSPPPPDPSPRRAPWTPLLWTLWVCRP